MARFPRSTAVLFLAAASVYPGQLNTAKAESAAKTASTDVKLLSDSTDPFAPTKEEAATKPVSEGQSVKNTQVNSNASGTVEIHVNDANILEVLRMLSLQSQTNIVASKDVKGTVTANLYDVTVTEALNALLKQNDLVSVEDGPVIYVYTRKEYLEVKKANRRTASEVFTMHYVPVVDAEKMVKNLLSPEGKTVITAAAKTGIGFDNATAGGDDSAGASLLMVTDYEENLANVRQLIQKIDVRPTQILVEATILRASLTEDNALGVDFTVLGGVDFSTIGTANGQITAANAANPITNPNNTIVSGGTGNSFSGAVPGGLKLGFVTNNVALFLSALEETTDTAVLANPKVLVLNKQKGEVKVVRKDPYRGAIVTDVNGQTRQEVETQETGTKLVFRPFVGNDGYIRLEIHPEDSTALPARAADLPPSQLSTEATTNVMVKDGRTIVIGGLFRESSTTTRSQIPVLGDIPGFGNLFRKKADSTVREEIIILLTPHIVKDDDAYAQMSAKEARDAERIRVGVRQGMMPWGRERLAESAYNSAVKEMAKPKPDKRLALWHLNIATNLNPKFLEAIDLKETISGKVVTSADNSSIRGFVRDAMLAGSVASSDPLDGPKGLASDEPAQLMQPVDFPVAAAAPSTQPVAPVAADAGENEPQTPVAQAKEPADSTAVEVAGEDQTTPPETAKPADPLADTDSLPPATVTVTELAGTDKVTTEPSVNVTVSNPLTGNESLPKVLSSTPDEPAVATADAAPATQPAAGDTPAFQVTELPSDDAIPASAGK